MGFSLWPTFRLRASIEEVGDLVAGFLPTNWIIHESRVRGNTVQVTAKATTRSFPLAAAVFVLSPDRGETVVQVRLCLGPAALIFVSLVLTASLVFQFKAVLQTIMPADAIPIILSIVLLLLWSARDHATGFVRALRKTGLPVTVLHEGLTQASPHVLALFALAEFSVFLTTLVQKNGWVVGSAGFAQSIAPLLVLFIALLLGQTAEGQLRYRLPYLVGIIALILYSAWPSLDDAVRNPPDHYALFGPVLFGIVLLGTLYMLWLTGNFLRDLLKRELDIVPPNHAKPTGVRFTVTGSVLLIWAIATYTQVFAVRSVITRFSHPPTMHVALVLRDAWCLVLIVAYATMAYRRVRRSITFRKMLQPPSAELLCRFSDLAITAEVHPPRVCLITGSQSFVAPRVCRRPMVCLSTAELAELDNHERDALLLHELYHVRKHSTLLGILEAVSVITLCGPGILTILVDPRQSELDADQAAITGLKKLRLPTAVLGTLISKAAGRETRRRFETTNHPGTHNVPSGAQLVSEMFFGDGASWYRHPTMTERLEAIGSTCHQ